ncbi:hypothetical protein KPL40_07195 [Clostridium gasigenes]|uniref:hypothetical protein n=1 Tax=Clostridium gasigenes TaxID=94869 RepID=UPI001C0CF0E0|nr:hypothetical protein [Clostridium gasigenes]MBU3132237.1 hypothetical protein [Clostridium gasigenes]
MKSNNNTKNKSKELICPICDEIMKQYDYTYDTLKDAKVNYKCDHCGHKSTKIL